MTEVFHEGVYGDHSTDGWLEWGLSAHYAMEAVGGDGTKITPEQAAENPMLAQHRTESIDKLGFLAAQELRLQGVEIVGFEDAGSDITDYARGYWDQPGMEGA